MQTILLEACGLDPRLPLVVGFSGGIDSLCLLSLLVELGWKVTAAHFDHHLRSESGLDADRAAELTRKLGVPFVLGGGGVAEYARVERLSIEAAARKMRYAFLFVTARSLGAQAVCTAHTADDQAETLLMHLLRGSGLTGLKGMQFRTIQAGWDREIPLIRPLLWLERSDTEAWCRSHGFEPVVDPSNADTTFTRNRIRHELLPYLETYNPNIRLTLARTAEVLASDYAIVSTAVESSWKDLFRGSGLGWVALDLGGLTGLEGGILRGVLRRAAVQLRPGLEDLDYDDILRAADFAHKPPRGGGSDLTGGLRVLVEEGRYFLIEAGAVLPIDRWPQLGADGGGVLQLPGEMRLLGGWKIRAERSTVIPLTYRVDETEAWLDAAKIPGELEVRAAREGDRIQPLGLEGKTQKLSDLWINHRILKRARAGYPLICCDDKIAWVPGLRLAESFRIDADTREAIHLTLIKIPPERYFDQC